MSIVLKSKKRVFGQSINSEELLEALKSPLLKDDAPIQVNTQFGCGMLKMIYRCPDCYKLHFLIGKISEEERLKAVVHFEIHADHFKDGKCVTKKELVAILEKLNDITHIALQDTDDPSNYSLTEVSKCSENCPAIHLDCAYDSDCILPN